MRKSLTILLVVFLIMPVLSGASDLFIKWNNGRLVVLNDSSGWLVHPNWQHHSRFWNLRDRVTVCTAMNPQGGYRYVLTKGHETLGILVKYSRYPLIYSTRIGHSQSPLPYLWKEKWRRDNRMWNVLNMFLLSKQLQAEQKESQQGQEQYKREQRKPRPKKRIVNLDETLVVHITREGSFFHRKTDCPFLKEACKNPKVNPIGTTVKRAKEAGCSLCPHCFKEQ